MLESPHRRAAARPVQRQADGTRGVCGTLLVSDRRCIERERGDAAQRADYITQVPKRQALRSISFWRLLALCMRALSGGSSGRPRHSLRRPARVPAMLMSMSELEARGPEEHERTCRSALRNHNWLIQASVSPERTEGPLLLP